MVILVFGAGSRTASSLIPTLLEETEATVHLVSSGPISVNHPRAVVHRLDILDKGAVKDVMLSCLPDTVVNLAAITNVDACETERSLCWAVNVTFVETLARYCRVTDAHLVHCSTDYVFDGSRGPYGEQDVPSPLGYYGKSKLASENIVTSAGIDATIVRTNVIYGADSEHTDFVRWVLKAFDASLPVNVVDDQFSNPTFVDDLAEAILHVVLRRRTGLYHVGGADYLSRYDFACRIADVFRVDRSLVVPVSTASLQQAAKRPARGGLIPLKAEADLRMRMSGVESGLVSFRHRIVQSHQQSLQRRVP